MSYVATLLNTVRYYTSDDDYHYTIDNRVAGDLAARDEVLATAFDAGLFPAALGFGTGAGGAVTQSSNKSTTVVLSKSCGSITMNSAALNANTAVSFTLTNTLIAATDVVTVCIKSGATTASYLVSVDAVNSGSCIITLRNLTGGNLSEAVVINFAVIKAVTS